VQHFFQVVPIEEQQRSHRFRHQGLQRQSCGQPIISPQNFVNTFKLYY
jgi:hypothetical protein